MTIHTTKTRANERDNYTTLPSTFSGHCNAIYNERVVFLCYTNIDVKL